MNPPGPFDLKVLHVDPVLRALDKPSGVSVLKDNTGCPSLSDLYEEALGEIPLWVHRLDKGTSGVLLVARTQESRRSLQRQFNRGEVKKTYLALVMGTPPEERGTIDLPLEKARKGRFRIASAGEGFPSRTDYEVLARSQGRTLLVCHPRTGRTHQIRVHLQSLGCPLVKDPLYGPCRGKPSENPHLTLHAWKVEFRHPQTGERLKVEAIRPEWAKL